MKYRHWFEVPASKIDAFVRLIPDYCGSFVCDSDSPFYLCIGVDGLRKGDFRRLHKFEMDLGV